MATIDATFWIDLNDGQLFVEEDASDRLRLRILKRRTYDDQAIGLLSVLLNFGATVVLLLVVVLIQEQTVRFHRRVTLCALGHEAEVLGLSLICGNCARGSL